jgi:uncharacterized protein (TIGR02145 family)
MYSKIILFIFLPIFAFSQVLSPNTTYYVLDYATNNTSTASANQQSFTTTDSSQTVTDIDGNTYNTVQIGTQVWMSENLKTSRYRNGGLIPNVVDDTELEALTTGAWCYNHFAGNNAINDKFYNWFATQGDSLCPTGWHVPSDAEWTVLVDYLGGKSVAGGKMKSVGTAYWKSPNTGATNESGFSAFPDNDGGYDNIGHNVFFWSATEEVIEIGVAWSRILDNSSSDVYRISILKESGVNVRCLKDLNLVVLNR